MQLVVHSNRPQGKTAHSFIRTHSHKRPLSQGLYGKYTLAKNNEQEYAFLNMLSQQMSKVIGETKQHSVCFRTYLNILKPHRNFVYIEFMAVL